MADLAAVWISTRCMQYARPSCRIDIYTLHLCIIAQELFQSTIEDMARTVGRDKWMTALTLHNFACLQETLGRDDEAIGTLTEAFSAKTSLLGLRNTTTLKTALFLGRLYRKNGHLADAEHLADQIRPFLQYA